MAEIIQDNPHSSVYDNVFRTIAQKMPQLLIPLINEVFHTDYREDEPFEHLRNEHYEKFGAIITDSIIRIQEHLYHIECQSTLDDNMTLRMFEYDIAIAVEHSTRDDDKNLVINFPESCVLYIRNHRTPPKFHQAVVKFPNGQSMPYQIPTLLAQDYSMDEIFAKSLLVLLPYHILRYEWFLKNGAENKEKVNILLNDYRHMMEKLEKTTCEPDKGIIYINLIVLIGEIANHILPVKGSIREEFKKIMGGNVIKLPSDYIEEEKLAGELKRKSMQLDNIRNIVNKIGITLDEAMNVLELSDEDRNYCRAQFAHSVNH